SERSLHHLEELRQPKLPEGITSLKIAGDEGVGLALLREAYAIEKRGPPDHGNPSLRKPFAAIAVQDRNVAIQRNTNCLPENALVGVEFEAAVGESEQADHKLKNRIGIVDVVAQHR